MAVRNMGFSANNQAQAGSLVGLNTVVIKISASVTVSAGDTWILHKIPHGAVPVDAVFYPNTAAWSNVIGKFGTSASPELYFNSATYSTVTRCANRLGWAMQISLSDDFMPRFENIVMVAGGGALAPGYLGDLVIEYVMPGQTF